MKKKQFDPKNRIVGIAADPKSDLIATIHLNSVATKLWYFRPSRISSLESMKRLDEIEQEGLAVFSNQPQLKMRNLLNPPKDPLKFAKTKIVVPFFLQQTTMVGKVIEKEAENVENMLKQLHEDVAPQTEFVQLMVKESLQDQPSFDESLNQLINMEYDQIALEISALRVDVEKDVDERLVFVNLLIYALKKRKEFDIVQTIMKAFLDEYGVKILEDRRLKNAIKELRDVQKEVIEFLDTDVSYSQYLVRLINRIQ